MPGLARRKQTALTVIQRLTGLQHLQAVGDAVWALVGEAAAATLWIWDGGSAWRHLSRAPGVPRAMAVEPGGSRVLLATGQPAAVVLLEADGQVLACWPLPADADPSGVAWLSTAS